MIELSPLDVRKKKEDFRRVLRGYDVEQVDAFLDLVAERLAGMLAEERSLRERVDLLEDKLERFEDREKALNDALVAAQELREEARTQAERDAELRIRESESRAEEIVQEARGEARSVERSLEDLRLRKERFLRSFRGTLQRFLEEVEAEQARARGDGEPGDEASRGEEGLRAPRMRLETGGGGDAAGRESAVPEANGGAESSDIRLGGPGEPPPSEGS